MARATSAMPLKLESQIQSQEESKTPENQTKVQNPTYAALTDDTANHLAQQFFHKFSELIHH